VKKTSPSKAVEEPSDEIKKMEMSASKAVEEKTEELSEEVMT